MKGSISLLRRIPPSLRRASLARMPGPTIPVGWNWTASGSITGKPALRTTAGPSPVFVAAVGRNPKHLSRAAGGQDDRPGQDGDELPFLNFKKDGAHTTAFAEKKFRNNGPNS